MRSVLGPAQATWIGRSNGTQPRQRPRNSAPCQVAVSPRSIAFTARMYSRSSATFAGFRPTPHAALSPVPMPQTIRPGASSSSCT